MTRGIGNVEYVRQGSEVTVADQPNWGFIYVASTVKDDRWAIGDRAVLPDGREYKYAKSSAACISGQGCEFVATGYTAITTMVVAAAVGDTTITVPAATHAALTKDELRGGYVVIYDGTTNNVQFRGIVGNDASILNVAFKIYLDGPLTEVITTASKCETFQNPFASVRTGTAVDFAKAGTPAVKVSAANTYFWVQTKGFTWVAPQSGLTGKQKGAMWRHDGSLDTVTNGVSGSASVLSQYAGYLVEGDYTNNGPLFYLQG